MFGIVDEAYGNTSSMRQLHLSKVLPGSCSSSGMLE
jgi:hypothetical protein